MKGELEQEEKHISCMSGDEACRGQASHVREIVEKLKKSGYNGSGSRTVQARKEQTVQHDFGQRRAAGGNCPITSAVTKVVYGKKPEAEVHYQNGVVEPVPFEKLSSFISEQENADNRLGVSSVVLRVPSKFFEKRPYLRRYSRSGFFPQEQHRDGLSVHEGERRGDFSALRRQPDQSDRN